jgi:hypothetical protein
MAPQNQNDALDSAMRRLDSLQSSLNGILAENVRTNTILEKVVQPKLDLVDKHEGFLNKAWGWLVGISVGSGMLGAKAAKAFGLLGDTNK